MSGYRVTERPMRVQWFARGGGILRCGPFQTQTAAAKAMLLAGSTPERPLFPDNVFIWPEPVKAKGKK